MAVNKRGRAYRLTPRRREALRKAQLASAAKRRGQHKRIAGVIGATLVAGGLGFAAHRRRSSSPVIKHTMSTSKELDIVRIAPNANRTNWTHVGKVAKTVVVRQPKKRVFPTYVQHEKARVKKEAARVKKNQKQRMKYWKGKPVGGAARKPYTSTKRGLR